MNNRNHKLSNKSTYALLLFTLCVTFLLYFKGINGPFLLDDLTNLGPLQELNSGSITTKQFIFGENGKSLVRPLSKASFLLFSEDFPHSAFSVKLINLLIHLLTGLLIFLCVRQLLKLSDDHNYRLANATSLLVSSLWLLHPLNVSTTLYSIQRMSQLATLFSLSALFFYLKNHQVLSYSNKIIIYVKISIPIIILGLAGVASKENALLLIPMILCITVILDKKNYSVYFRYYQLLLLALTFFILFLLIKYSLNSPLFEIKGFTIYERFLTQTRVITNYIFQILLPNYQSMSLLNDDILISTGITSPISTLYSTLLIIFAISMIFLPINKVYKLGISWFFIWHLIESTILPLDIYYEHRNYLPSIGPLMCLAYFINDSSIFKNRLVKASLVSVLLLSLSFQTFSLSKIWSNEDSIYLHWLENHPNSSLTLIELHKIFLKKGQLELAYQLLEMTETNPVFENDYNYWLYYYNISCVINKPQRNITKHLLSLSTVPLSSKLLNAGGLETVIMNILNNNCKPEDIDKINNIITNISINSASQRLPNMKANMLLNHSYIYLHYGDLTTALKLTEESFRVLPTANALRKLIEINLLLSKTSEAERWIIFAKSKPRWLNHPSLVDLLNK